MVNSTYTKRKFNTAYALTAATLCMLLGVGIYACAREHILFMEYVGWHGRHYTSGGIWADWIVYSLPDGLWYMALLLSMVSLGHAYQSSQTERRLSNAMLTIAILLPFLLEFLQKIHIVSGTFDYIDVITYCLTLLIFISLCKAKSLYLLCCKHAA